MNWRAPYSPPAPARQAALPPPAAPSRHENPHAQIRWNHCFAGARGGVVAARNDAGADAVARCFETVSGDLLCGRRHRLGAAGDADHQLDVAKRLSSLFPGRDAARSACEALLRRTWTPVSVV